MLHVEPIPGDFEPGRARGDPRSDRVPPGRRRVARSGTGSRVLDAGRESRSRVLDCVVGATDGSSSSSGPTSRCARARRAGRSSSRTSSSQPDAARRGRHRDRRGRCRRTGHRLSAGHSGCHLASLALNAALAGAWSKERRLDGLGSPDFDGTAIESSTIFENGSRDVYRVGKSVRKKGFDPAALDDPAALAAAANATLASWIAAGGEIRIEREGERLTDRRYWVAELPGGRGADRLRRHARLVARPNSAPSRSRSRPSRSRARSG